MRITATPASGLECNKVCGPLFAPVAAWRVGGDQAEWPGQAAAADSTLLSRGRRCGRSGWNLGVLHDLANRSVPSIHRRLDFPEASTRKSEIRTDLVGGSGVPASEHCMRGVRPRRVGQQEAAVRLRTDGRRRRSRGRARICRRREEQRGRGERRAGADCSWLGGSVGVAFEKPQGPGRVWLRRRRRLSIPGDASGKWKAAGKELLLQRVRVVAAGLHPALLGAAIDSLPAWGLLQRTQKARRMGVAG